jgi:AraC-like DNA-binding protein
VPDRPARGPAHPLDPAARAEDADRVPAQSYVERPPVAALRGVVRSVWVQRVGAEPYVQRNLPTGGVELHCVLGAVPRLVGPLTGPLVECLAPGTTVVGVRFRPGAPLGLPASELVDVEAGLDELWGTPAVALGESMHEAPTPEAALGALQAFLVRRHAEPDALMAEAVRRLMPWRAAEVGALSADLSISVSQLRRRCLAAVGLGPKVLQRTLRFQGFLALVQAGGGQRGGLAGLAAAAGYADQAHLARECLRLTGLSPGTFVGDVAGRCACGHDHSASYRPYLALSFKPGLGTRP